MFISLPDANDPATLYRLQTEWCENSFSIMMLVNSPEVAAYCGQMTTKEAIDQSGKRKEELKEYIDLCKESLNPELNAEKYCYKVQDNSFIIKTIPKKGSSIRVTLANIKLEKTDLHETMFKMFDTAMKHIKDINVEKEDLIKEKKSILESYDNAVKTCNEMETQKNEMEKELLSQFVVLLNTKKDRIAVLEGREQPANLIEDDQDMETLSDASAYSVDTNKDEEEMQENLPAEPNEEVAESEEAAKELKLSPDPPARKQHESLGANQPSRIESILSSMSFLDPTIPYNKKT